MGRIDWGELIEVKLEVVGFGTGWGLGEGDFTEKYRAREKRMGKTAGRGKWKINMGEKDG